jgi:hypothetical protein
VKGSSEISYSKVHFLAFSFTLSVNAYQKCAFLFLEAIFHISVYNNFWSGKVKMPFFAKNGFCGSQVLFPFLGWSLEVFGLCCLLKLFSNLTLGHNPMTRFKFSLALTRPQEFLNCFNYLAMSKGIGLSSGCTFSCSLSGLC